MAKRIRGWQAHALGAPRGVSLGGGKPRFVSTSTSPPSTTTGGSFRSVTGGPFTYTFTSAAAIRAFLPQGKTPAALKATLVNPTAKVTVFAGQVLALQINVGFSNALVLPPGLGTFVLPSGPAAGLTVNQVLADANKALGGGGLPAYVTSISQLSDVVASINEMFD